MRDDDATAIVLMVKTALGPVLERLAASEQANKDLQARVADLVGMRDRLVTVETKAALSAPIQPEAVSVDLSPVLERISASEARLAVLGDLRDRVVTVETKAADVASHDHLREKVATLTQDIDKDTSRLEGYIAALQRDLSALCERVVMADAKAALYGHLAVADLAPVDLAASLAGVLRQELADLPVTKTARKVVRDAQGAVKFEIEETT